MKKFFLGDLWFLWLALSCFGSFISMCQINSYRADLNHLNGFWTGATIVLGLVGIFCLYKVATKSNSGGGSSVK